MKHVVAGNFQPSLLIVVAAGVMVAIEIGEIATRDIHPDAVASEEAICGRQHLDLELDRLVGRQQHRRRSVRGDVV